MYLPKNLRYLRLKNGFSQEYLAQKFGYKSYTTIQKWESGTAEPSLSILDELGKLYGYDLHELYTKDLEFGQESAKKSKRIPLIGTIAAGKPILAEENIVDHFVIDSRVKADFVLTIKGDSMIGAGILPGDMVFIRRQETLENGEIGAILIDNEATLKKFYKEKGTVILQSENEAHQPIVLTNGEVRILGKLIAVLNIRE